MRIDILTLFPDMMRPVLEASIVGRAVTAGCLDIGVHDIRNWTTDRHRTVDDTPYGGGPGMVMKCEPLVAAIESVQAMSSVHGRVLYPTPDGKVLTQRQVEEWSGCERLIILCGHYEGVDQRVRDGWVHEEYSLGDYVLTGGELPALILVDALVRLIPGALGNPLSAIQESHGSHGLLDHPHYTRPPDFRGLPVPPELLSGDHGAIEHWRRLQSDGKTRIRRPDMWFQAGLDGSALPELTRLAAVLPSDWVTQCATPVEVLLLAYGWGYPCLTRPGYGVVVDWQGKAEFLRSLLDEAAVCAYQAAALAIRVGALSDSLWEFWEFFLESRPIQGHRKAPRILDLWLDWGQGVRSGHRLILRGKFHSKFAAARISELKTLVSGEVAVVKDDQGIQAFHSKLVELTSRSPLSAVLLGVTNPVSH